MVPEYGRCPGEIYGMTVAGSVLPSLYQSQSECGEIHGCVRDACPLEKRWHKQSPRQEERPGNLWAFVVAALMGPRKP